MMKTYFRISLVVACCTLLVSSCTSSEDTEEKGVIDKHTERVAQDAVDRIKTPLDQAKRAVEQENAHIRQMEDRAKTQ